MLSKDLIASRIKVILERRKVSKKRLVKKAKTKVTYILIGKRLAEKDKTLLTPIFKIGVGYKFRITSTLMQRKLKEYYNNTDIFKRNPLLNPYLRALNIKKITTYNKHFFTNITIENWEDDPRIECIKSIHGLVYLSDKKTDGTYITKKIQVPRCKACGQVITKKRKIK
jgi:hypothetical protein